MLTRHPDRPGLRAAGLTLVEVLVALAILSLLSVLAYRALDSTMRVRERVTREADYWRQLSFFFNRLQDDLDQPAIRGPRLPDGIRLPVWTGTDSSLEFGSLGSGANPLRHVQYRHQTDRIELLLWPAYESGPASVPEVHAMVTGVRSLRFSYLNRTLTWLAAWPPRTADANFPRALRVDIVMADGKAINRIFALP